MEWSGIISQEENLLSNYFNGFNEGIIGGEAETRGFMVRCGERPFAVRGGGYLKSR